MRRKWVVVLALVVLAVLAWLGHSQGVLPSFSPTPTPLPTQEAETVIWASGKVVPATWATLSFETAGRIAAVAVSAGEEVTAGQVLARLDDSTQVDSVNSAKADLRAADAEYARAAAGARPAEIAQAEAAVQVGQAVVDTARAQLAEAQARLDLLLAGATHEDIETAAAAMLKADAGLKLAQAEYDKIKWADDVGESPQALSLQQATLDYQVAAAAYQAVVKGPRQPEIEAARQIVAAAEAQRKRSDAELAVAQASLDLLLSGPAKEVVEVARSAVDQAQTRLAAAENALEHTVLKAPFSGTIGDVFLHAGEIVIPGQLQPVMVIGDLNLLQVETTDLRETNVGHISVGQQVDLTFDALPATELTGHIVSIEPMATSEKGGVNFTTIVALDETDARLRWGMTAYVTIVVE